MKAFCEGVSDRESVGMKSAVRKNRSCRLDDGSASPLVRVGHRYNTHQSYHP